MPRLIPPQCRSPYIITYYGAYFSDSRIKICTEFMDGVPIGFVAMTRVMLGRELAGQVLPHS